MKKQYILSVASLALVMGLSSCVNDLDVTPKDPSTVMEVDEPALYTKCIANMAIAGQGGANGDCDINGLDGGTTGFVRQLWNANELPTDEAVCGWGDTGIPAFNFNTWDASHPMLQGFYYRLYTGISYCNHYLTECTTEAQHIAEIRFVRALYYYYLMDCFGNVPFTTVITMTDKPHQIKRADLFQWIEDELIGGEHTFYAMDAPDVVLAETTSDGCINNMLPSAARNSSDGNWGRPDVDAANLLLARMYLNAKVYTGSERWSDALTYAKKVINGKHALNTTSVGNWSAYQMLFMGDNGETSASTEAIFPLLQDGTTTTSWGTTLFLMASTWKKDMNYNNDYNTTEFWAGNRSRSKLVEKFFPDAAAPNANIEDMVKAAKDDRALFYGIDRTQEVTTTTEFTNGFSVAKYRNTYTTGATGHSSQFVDADFFLMRSAEAYLIAAEASKRLGNNDAASYINVLRKRANCGTMLSESECTLDEILDERARELYFEGYRRTDLIRYGYFGGQSDYKWEWKGSVKSGTNFEEYRNIYAIPSEDLNANTNLKQNTGY